MFEEYLHYHVNKINLKINRRLIFSIVRLIVINFFHRSAALPTMHDSILTSDLGIIRLVSTSFPSNM